MFSEHLQKYLYTFTFILNSKKIMFVAKQKFYKEVYKCYYFVERICYIKITNTVRLAGSVYV